ncbi:motility associated factor glycosyltransferase family protein [Pelagicoccus albus]|uniref:Motility associated factor glycosyltransferase family protein n=1 Tax=Pelagicoccus albus TaxID=415222 RepID=A0A7X1B7E8_9BACT|nr:6-hydroxymethylpterin diphosphokinase MptE-like protein [Pelagicoccus albus]MBC2605775.1 motility associated factor glycosyltransferase family protein [Pelagicoccus albus]
MNRLEELFVEKHSSLRAILEEAFHEDVELAAWREQARDPKLLLERWASGLRFPEDSAIALSGVGDGSHIKAVLEAMPESGMVFCAEADPERFKAFLRTSVAEELLADPRVALGTGPLDERFFESLRSFPVMDFEHAEPVVFAPLFNEAESYYSEFFTEFARRLDVCRKLVGTLISKSGLWQGNSIRNLPTLARSPDPMEFFGAFDGVPMIMAGAGPSLDESLDFLRWAQDRAVIVAGNSSIRALVNGGVRPHFVLAADPNRTTDSGFEGVELGDTILICPFMVYPAVVERFGENVIAWAKGNELASYFRNAAGVQQLAHVTEHGTVSACAFDIALIFGCSSLHFVGQDLAVRSDGRLHNSDSFYRDEGKDVTNVEKCRWVEGNTVDKVPVEEKLFVYLKTFEMMARAYAKEMQPLKRGGLVLYNHSRLGAKVEHMPYLDFDQAKQRLDRFSSSSFRQKWKRVQRTLSRYMIGWGKIESLYLELQGYLESICSLALRHAMALELGESDQETARAAKSELLDLIKANPNFEAIMDSGQLQMELYVYNRTRLLKSRKKEGAQSVEHEALKDYFWAVAEGSYQTLAAFEGSLLAKAKTEELR